MAQRPDLQAALASGDPQRVDALADTVALTDIPVVLSSTFHAGMTSASFALLRAAAALEPPAESPLRMTWLQTLNNACLCALLAPIDDDARRWIAGRASPFAPENPPIYRNAASIYARLGDLEMALSLVEQAATEGDPDLASYGTDDDLAALRALPRFQEIMKKAQEALHAAVEEALTPWRGEAPPELRRVVRGQLRGLGLPTMVIALTAEAPSLSPTLPPSMVRFLREKVLWATRLQLPGGSMPAAGGYVRDARSASAEGEGEEGLQPFILLTEQGLVREAPNLSAMLHLLAAGYPEPPEVLRLLDMNIHNEVLDAAPKAANQSSSALVGAFDLEDESPDAIHDRMHAVPIGRLRKLSTTLLAETRSNVTDEPVSREVWLLVASRAPSFDESATRFGGPSGLTEPHEEALSGDPQARPVHALTIGDDAPSVIRTHLFGADAPTGMRASYFLDARLHKREAQPILHIHRQRKDAPDSLTSVTQGASANTTPRKEVLTKISPPQVPTPTLPLQRAHWIRLSVPEEVLHPPKPSWTPQHFELASALCLLSGWSLDRTPNRLRLQTDALGAKEMVRTVRVAPELAGGKESLSQSIRGPHWHFTNHLIAQVGLPLPFLATPWSDVTRGPMSVLEQSLCRLCHLLRPHADLSFRALEEAATAGSPFQNEWGAIRFALKEHTVTVSLGESTQENFEAIQGAANDLMTRTHTPWRLYLFHNRLPKMLWVPKDWRPLLSPSLDGQFSEVAIVGDADPLDAIEDDALETMSDEELDAVLAQSTYWWQRATDPELNEGALSIPLPTTPTLSSLLPSERIFEEDPSYVSLLAQHLARMAEHLGIPELSAEPRPVAPAAEQHGHLSLRLPYYGQTLSIAGADARVDPCIAAQTLSSFLEGDESLLTVRLGATHTATVRVTPDEASILREHAFVVEDWRVRWARAILDTSGLQLPSFFTTGTMDILAKQMNALAGKNTEMHVSFHQNESRADAPDEGNAPSTWTVTIAGQRLSLHGTDVSLTALLQQWLPTLNGALARANIAHRWVRYDRRYESGGSAKYLQLIPTDWSTTLARLFPEVADSLGDALLTDPQSPSNRLPFTYPQITDEHLALPQLPTVRQLVPDKRRMSSDFKCSARESDYPEVFEALATLAGLSLDVYPRAERLENGYRYQVRAYDGDGHEHRVLIDNHKYADVTPFLVFLNERLEETEEERRLMLFHESDDAGVVFVDEEEAEVLSGFGHVEEPE